MWKKYPELRPDYENYVERTKIIDKVDAKILAQQLKEEEEKAAEEARIKELKALKKEEEEKANEEVIIIESNPVAVHGE
jgi:Tfp pilus assembly protein PilE